MRMRHFVLLVAAFVFYSRASAMTVENMRASAESGIANALSLAVHPDLLAKKEPIFQKPLIPQPTHPGQTLAPVVAKVALSSIIEHNRRLMYKTFGKRALDMGVAGNISFEKKFMTFSDAKTTTLADLGELDQLRTQGVDVRVDENTFYHVKLTPNVFNPVRGSTLHMTPIQGTSGPSHKINTGDLLDAVRARSFVFRVGSQDLWMFYGTDALDDGSGFANTRSFLFIKEAGLSSKAWPLSESKLAVDTPSAVDLGDIRLTLTRTSGGELIIREFR